jgi:selenocysteine lyase/cysteine desulfurase
VDACQSVGQYPVDVKRIGCDLLSATGRKYLRAPRGTGFLYVKQDRLSELHPPFPDVRAATWTAPNNYTLRNDAKRFENWENNYAAIMGLGKAVDYTIKLGITNIRKQIELLATELREKLRFLPGVTVTDIGKQKSGIVTFTMNSLTAKQIQQNLAQKNINVSVSSQSSTLLDMQRRKLKEVVRASVHYYNTPREIDILINELRTLN